MEGDILHAKKVEVMHVPKLSSHDSGPTKENLIQTIIRTVTQPISTIMESSTVHAQRRQLSDKNCFVPNGVIVHITAGACPPTTPPCRDPGNESSSMDDMDAKDEKQEDETCEEEEDEECEDEEEEECEEEEGTEEEEGEEEECEDEEAEEECEEMEEPVTKPAPPPPPSPVVPPKPEEDECEECPIHDSGTDEFCKELPDDEEDEPSEHSPCAELPRWERKKKNKVIEGECIAEDELKMICKKYRAYDKRPAWKESPKEKRKPVCTCEPEDEDAEEEMPDVCSMEKQFKDPLVECDEDDTEAGEQHQEEGAEEEEEPLFFDADPKSCPKCKCVVVPPCEEIKPQENVGKEDLPYFTPTQHFVPWNEEPKPPVEPQSKTQPKTVTVGGSYYGEPKQKKRLNVPAPDKKNHNQTNLYASEGVFGKVKSFTETHNENIKRREIKPNSQKSDYIAEKYFGPYKSPNFNNNYNVGNVHEYSSEYTGSNVVEHSDSESSAYTTYVRTAPSVEEASGGFWHGGYDNAPAVARHDDCSDNKDAYADDVAAKLNIAFVDSGNAVEYSNDVVPVEENKAEYLTEPEYSDFTLSDTNNQHCPRASEVEDGVNSVSPYTNDDVILKSGKYNGYDIACLGDEDIYFEKGDEVESLSDASYCSSNEKSPRIEEVLKQDGKNIPVAVTRDESPDCGSCASSVSDRDSSPDGRYKSPHRVRASTSERFIIEALEDCEDESDIDAMLIPKVSSMSTLVEQPDDNVTPLAIKLASFTSSPIENFKRLFTTFTKKALGLEDDYVPKTESRRESVRKDHLLKDGEKRSIKRDHSRSVTITPETHGQELEPVNNKPQATDEGALNKETSSQQIAPSKDVAENSEEPKPPESKAEEKEEPLNFQNVLGRIVDAFKPSEPRTYNGPYREGTRQFKRAASTSPGRTSKKDAQKKHKPPKTQSTNNESPRRVSCAEPAKGISGTPRKVVEVEEIIERSIVPRKTVEGAQCLERTLVTRHVVSPVSSVMAMQVKETRPKEVKKVDVTVNERKVLTPSHPKGRHFTFGMFHNTRVAKKEEKVAKNPSPAFRALKSKSDKTLTANSEKGVRVQPFLSRNKRISTHRDKVIQKPTFESEAPVTTDNKSPVTHAAIESTQESMTAKKTSPGIKEHGQENGMFLDIKKFIESHTMLLENNRNQVKTKTNAQLELNERKDPMRRPGNFSRKSLKTKNAAENVAPSTYKWKSSRKIEQYAVLTNGHKLTEYKRAKRMKSQQNPTLPTDCNMDDFHERIIALEMCESANRKRQRAQSVSNMPHLLSNHMDLNGDGHVGYVPQLMSNTINLTDGENLSFVPQLLSNGMNLTGGAHAGEMSNGANSTNERTVGYAPQIMSNNAQLTGDGGQSSGTTSNSGQSHGGLWYPDVPVNIVKTQELYRNMKQTNSLMDEIVTLTKQGQIATAIQKFRSQEQSVRNSNSAEENDSDSSSSLDNSVTSDEDVGVKTGAYLPYMEAEDHDVGDTETFLSPNSNFFDQIDVILQGNDNINDNKGTESSGEIASGQCGGNADDKINSIIHHNTEKAGICHGIAIKYPKTFDFTNRAKPTEVEQCNFSHELTDGEASTNARTARSVSPGSSPRALPFQSHLGAGAKAMKRKRDGTLPYKTSRSRLSPNSSRFDRSTSSKGSNSKVRRNVSGDRSRSLDKPKPRPRSPSAHTVSEAVDVQSGKGLNRGISKNNVADAPSAQPCATETAGERSWQVSDDKTLSNAAEETKTLNPDPNKPKNDKSSSSWKHMTRWRPPDNLDTEPDVELISKQPAEAPVLDVLKKNPNASSVELASQMRDKIPSKSLKYVEARPRWRSPRGELRHQANSSKTRLTGKQLKNKDAKQKKSAPQKGKLSPSRNQTNYSARRNTDTVVTSYDSNKFRAMLQEPKRPDSQGQDNKFTHGSGQESSQYTTPQESKHSSNTHQDSKHAHSGAVDSRQLYGALNEARQVGGTHQDGKVLNGSNQENKQPITTNEEAKEKPLKIEEKKSEDKKRKPVQYSTVNYSPAKEKVVAKSTGKDKSKGDAKKRDKRSPQADTRVRPKSPIRGRGYSKSEHFMKNRASGATSPVPVDTVSTPRPQSIGSKFRALLPEKVTASRSHAAAIKETPSRSSILKLKKDERQKPNLKKPDPKKLKSGVVKAVNKTSPKQREEPREVVDHQSNESLAKAYDIPPSILNEGGTLLDTASRTLKNKTESRNDAKGKETYLHQFRSYTPSPTLVKPKHSFHKIETPYFANKGRRSETEISPSGSGDFFQSRPGNVERNRVSSPTSYQYSAPPQRDDSWFPGYIPRESPTQQSNAYGSDTYNKQPSERVYASEDSYYSSTKEYSYRRNTDSVYSRPQVEQDGTDYSTYADFRQNLSYHAISNSNLSNVATAIRSNYAVAQSKTKPKEPPQPTASKSSKSYVTPTQLTKESNKKPAKTPTPPETLSPTFLPEDETPTENSHSKPEPEQKQSSSDGSSFQLGMLSRLFSTFTRQSSAPTQMSPPERSNNKEKSGTAGKKTSNATSENRNSSNRGNTNRNNLKWKRSNIEAIGDRAPNIDTMEFDMEMLMNFNSNASVSSVKINDQSVYVEESQIIYTDELVERKAESCIMASLVENVGNINSNAESRRRKRDEEMDQSMSEMGSNYDDVEFDRFEEVRRKDPDQPIYRVNKCLSALTVCGESGADACNTLNTLLEWNIVLLIVIFILFVGTLVPGSLHNIILCPVPSLSNAIHTHFLEPLGLDLIIARWMEPAKYSFWPFQYGAREPTKGVFYSFLYQVIVVSVRLILYVLIYIFIPILSVPFLIIGPVISALTNATSCTLGTIWNTVFATLDNTLDYLVSLVSTAQSSSSGTDTALSDMKSYPYADASGKEAGDAGEYGDVTKNLHSLRKHGSFLFYFGFDQTSDKCKYSFFTATYLWLIGQFPKECL